MIATTSYNAQNNKLHHVSHSVQDYAVSENKECERTLAIVSCSDQLQDIIEYIKKNGFTIIVSKQFQFTEDQAKELYENHKKQTYYDKQVEWLKSTVVCAMILEKENAISDWKKLMGPMNYKKAKKTNKESIRAIFGKDASQNATHGSDTDEYARQEIEYIFQQSLNSQQVNGKTQAPELDTYPGNNDSSSQVHQNVPQEIIEFNRPEEATVDNSVQNEKENNPSSVYLAETPVSNKEEQDVTNETSAQATAASSEVNDDSNIHDQGHSVTDGSDPRGLLEDADHKEDNHISNTMRDTLVDKNKANDDQESPSSMVPVQSEAIVEVKTTEQKTDNMGEENSGETVNLENTKQEIDQQQSLTKAVDKDEGAAKIEPETTDDDQSAIIESYTISGSEEQEHAELTETVHPEHVDSDTSSTKDIKESTTAVSSTTEVDSADDIITAEDEKITIGESRAQKSRHASLKKSDAMVEPSRSRIRPPSIIRDKKGVLTPPISENNKQIPKPKLNRGTTRIARLSNNAQVSSNEKPETKPVVKKSSVTKISKNLPRVATLTAAKAQEAVETDNKAEKVKKRHTSTKSFITRLTAPTVASENKKAAATTVTANDVPRPKVKSSKV